MQAARHREGLALALLAMCIFMTIPSAVGFLQGRVDSTSVTAYLTLIAVAALYLRNLHAPIGRELRGLRHPRDLRAPGAVAGSHLQRPHPVPVCLRPDDPDQDRYTDSRDEITPPYL